MKKIISRQQFFDKTVHHPKVKASLISKHEELMCEVLRVAGFTEGIDFMRQEPIGEIGVADFAFPAERLVIELDGRSHKLTKQRLKDNERDWYMLSGGWDILRLSYEVVERNPSFFKSLISYHIKDRRGVKEEDNTNI